MNEIEATMEISKWLPIAISTLALTISLGSLYLQHFRRVRKGSATVLWGATWSIDAKNTSIEFMFDIAISNQGNRPFVVSRVWLISKIRDGNKRRYECEKLNQDNPLKVAAASIEYMHLEFKASLQEFLSDLGNPTDSTETTLEAMIFVTDDEGKEYYSMLPIMNLLIKGDKFTQAQPITSSVNILQKTKKKSQ